MRKCEYWQIDKYMYTAHNIGTYQLMNKKFSLLQVPNVLDSSLLLHSCPEQTSSDCPLPRFFDASPRARRRSQRCHGDRSPCEWDWSPCSERCRSFNFIWTYCIYVYHMQRYEIISLYTDINRNPVNPHKSHPPLVVMDLISRVPSARILTTPSKASNTSTSVHERTNGCVLQHPKWCIIAAYIMSNPSLLVPAVPFIDSLGPNLLPSWKLEPFSMLSTCL